MNGARRTEVIGDCTLYLGDCLDILPHLGSVDAVVTDPPYGIDGGSGGDARDYGKGNYSGAFADTPEYISRVCVEAIKIAIEISDAVALTPGIRCAALYPQPRDMGCFWTPAACTHGPWGMTTMQPIYYYGKDWRAGKGAWPSGRQLTERAEPNGHPCPKPILGWTWLVEKTTPPDGLCLDPFMGSGTTGVACAKLGRKFVGIEIDEGYFDIACRRIEAAYHQPDMFIARPAAATQEALL
jgi:site-specific DNA-methyltransferase (adenine-specific)